MEGTPILLEGFRLYSGKKEMNLFYCVLFFFLLLLFCFLYKCCLRMVLTMLSSLFICLFVCSEV